MNAPVNILLVDDEARNLDALECILASPDYRLVRAQSADEALARLIAETFALLVLDIRMPGMTGLELAQVVKQRRKMRELPIIFLTAYYQEEDHVMLGYGAGAVDYLSKPCNPDILRSKVAVFVDLFRKSRALEAEITERRAAEQRVRELNEQLAGRVAELGSANAELEAFSCSVSHDLRAPLRQVAGFVGSLRKASGSNIQPTAAEYLSLIESSVSRMGRLIDDLLEFSRMGRVEMMQQLVDLHGLLDQAIRLLRLETHNRTIEWHIEPLPEVRGDPAMLRQVWTCLLDNALKFTRYCPCAQIEVGCKPLPGANVFHMRDNGVGFDPRFTDKLFGVFQRLHARTEFEGTGIGLANVRRIIHRHGGKTWAESRQGEGATIYFSLPKIEDSPNPTE